MEKVIKRWLYSLISKQSLPKEMVDVNFFIEDGMNLDEYWDYEKNSFDSFSEIFDLTVDFNVKIIHIEKIRKDASLVWFYVINKKNKIVFKMSITINNENRISSNNFNTQFVSKFRVENKELKFLGLAIKSKYPIEKIISPDLELLHFSEGANFIEDGFYSASFNVDNFEFNMTYQFFVKFKDNPKLEKRVIFFDQLRIEDCPYIIENNKLTTNDEMYPVNLAIFYSENRSSNFIYPRNKSVDLVGVEQIVVTDVLDNDWIIRF